MSKFIRLLFLLSTVSYSVLHSQVTGIVTDSNANPLVYVNVYLKGTSTGTTTNNDGNYRLQIEAGEHTLVFQYLGYEILEEPFSYDGNSLSMNVVLKEKVYELENIVISANAEDPAYAIIRKAQARRKAHLSQFDNFEFDAYVKGFTKLTESPDKVLGIDVGDAEGAIDSTGAGVVYLSESISKIYFKDGKSKEILYSSKISGDDMGYSFNSAQEMDFNFYRNLVELNKGIVSPIASNALNYYEYKLEGASLDNLGQLVNKIKVTPKNPYEKCFSGYIYINENTWSINAVNLFASKDATDLPFVDTLRVVQTLAPVEQNAWVPLSNVVSFNVGLLGFKAHGSFAGVYSDYKFGQVDSDIFDKVTYEVLEEANKKEDTYWEEVRPIPLTGEERIDYHEKDSIQIIRSSPEYLDSIDRIANNFGPIDLINGYKHQNSKVKSSIDFKSPINQIQLNTIQGWHTTIDIRYNKFYDEHNTNRLRIFGSVNGGLSEKKIRPILGANYLFDRLNNLYLTFEIGEDVTQFSRINTITDRLNTITTWWFRDNFLKAYDKRFVHLGATRQLGFGVRGGISLDVERRSPLVINFRSPQERIDRGFTSNNPERLFIDDPSFNEHSAAIFRAHLVFNFKQEIWKYPYRVWRQNSDWPTIGLYYKTAQPVLGTDVEYHLLYSRIEKRWRIGLYGNFELSLSGGSFLGDEKPDYFMDYFHFSADQTFVGHKSNYINRYLKLEPYQFSTADSFFSGHVQHNFDGFLLDKIPIVRRLGFSLAGGYKYLVTSDNPFYQELHIGIDKIGFGAFRFFRVDLVWNKETCDTCFQGWDFGVFFGSQFRI